jgi:predicted alpha-1,6-mannanase (GH76 family)
MDLFCKLTLVIALFNTSVLKAQINWSKAADSAQQALTKQFWSADNKYYLQNNDTNTRFNYWWNAHALDVLVDGYLRTKDPTYTSRMKDLLTGMYKQNGNKWENDFYDDMEWLTLACLRAYDATNDKQYKDLAQTLWDLIKAGWTNINGGGIQWEKHSPKAKNACSNGPAIIIAARMYKLNKHKDELDFATKIYHWQRANLVDAARGIVWDSYGNHKENAMYTYNQGTWLGGALELYTITKDTRCLQDAIRNANYVINDRQKFSPNGILKGEGSGDGGLFKGIFIRYLVQLIKNSNVDVHTRLAYKAYLVNNGESLLNKATYRPDYVFNSNWSTLPASPIMDCSIQLSACMLLEALAGVTK